MTTIATLFSGFDLIGIGAGAAGLSHLWGIEWDDAIANVTRTNGFHTITADILDVDPHTLPIPDVLHASPVCTRASVANRSAEVNEDGLKESSLDIAMGEKVAQFIDVMTPRVVTIENVYGYRHFKAFKAICAVLDRNGYWWDYDNINCADYFVPQTRRRLFLRARRGALLPMLPQPEKWIGWYEAIEDLIPGLPESKFAPWQLARLPVELRDHLLFEPTEMRNNGQQLLSMQQGCTLKASRQENFRAFILDQNYGNSNTDGNERILSIRNGNEPVFTISTGGGGKREYRAWLVSGGNSFQPVLEGDAPSFVLGASPSVNLNHRAFLIPGTNASNDTVRYADDPACVIDASGKGVTRAWLSQGRVVKITPRALARLQSIPDDYILPDNNKLACRGIGNGFPPLAYQKLIAPMVEGL